ncbi:hypothetical protein Q574_02561, partial [Staphylococcus aureus M1523]
FRKFIKNTKGYKGRVIEKYVSFHTLQAVNTYLNTLIMR